MDLTSKRKWLRSALAAVSLLGSSVATTYCGAQTFSTSDPTERVHTAKIPAALVANDNPRLTSRRTLAFEAIQDAQSLSDKPKSGDSITLHRSLAY
jgi:hypothetical protein